MITSAGHLGGARCRALGISGRQRRESSASRPAVGEARAAVEALETELFHRVLMDIQMPRMDGFEATAAIREAEKIIPITAMTARALKGDQDRCIAAGMDGYVSKPTRSIELFAVMERSLANKPVVNSLV